MSNYVSDKLDGVTFTMHDDLLAENDRLKAEIERLRELVPPAAYMQAADALVDVAERGVAHGFGESVLDRMEAALAALTEAKRGIQRTEENDMTEHTKEPWKFDEENQGVSPQPSWGLLDSTGASLPIYVSMTPFCDAALYDYATGETLTQEQFTDRSRANANRVVACVNALANIPDPAAYMKAVDALVTVTTVARSEIARLDDDAMGVGATGPAAPNGDPIYTKRRDDIIEWLDNTLAALAEAKETK